MGMGVLVWIRKKGTASVYRKLKSEAKFVKSQIRYQVSILARQHLYSNMQLRDM
jgi:hypothetical protein